MRTVAKFYLVGGAVRDKLLGVASHDLDYAVECASYHEMKQAIVERGGQIFKEDEKYFTVRAKVPTLGATDYVLCRKDSAGYADGRRPDFVEVGTIFDDLARRDFTVNAIAKDADTGDIIDPHNGRADIQTMTLRCVGEAPKRFMEDRLRLLRAIRFSITKGFKLDASIVECLEEMSSGVDGVSVERVREELLKCFEFDTVLTLHFLGQFPSLAEACFVNRKLILKPTIRN
jgi:tRNA nucleotidyltransferase (CCA-adding enzyme)